MSDDHNCLEVLLAERILIQVKPGDEDHNPISHRFKNITNETSHPKTQYFLLLDEDDLEEIKKL